MKGWDVILVGRKVYLDNRPWEEAFLEYMESLKECGALKPGRAEKISVDKARCRVTAGPVYAAVSSPHYAAAAMDGYALKAAATFGASETSPVKLKVEVTALPVDTGDPLPAGCDAVVMVEDVNELPGGFIELIAPLAPHKNVRPAGEDVAATEMLLPQGCRLRPYDLGGLLAGGVLEVEVHPQPLIGLIPTGDEVVEPGGILSPGAIVEYNSRVLGGLVEEWGGLARRYPITPDDPASLSSVVKLAVAECDLVIVNAGSSAGRADYTARVVAELGRVLTHGVAIRPGKPTLLGIVANKPVLGIPGYPVSAALALELFARPIIYIKQGLLPPERSRLTAVVTRKIYSPLGQEEFLRVRVGRVAGRVVAVPLPRGAGAISSLLRADGLVRIPRLSEGLAPGEIVEIELIRPTGEALQSILVLGSHDLALDVLGNHLHRLFPGVSLSSANVGSLQGLLAVRRGEAHFAGVHLLDEDSGEYNVSFVKRYLADEEVVLVNLTWREQGFLVAKGNPKAVHGLKDLARQDINFINRQPGSGTRSLLDHLLRQNDIESGSVRGYEREEYTHLAVGLAVASGSVDCGLGILAVARALDLDFIPVAKERYDLCLRQQDWEGEVGKHLRAVLINPQFLSEVTALGGYDLSQTGAIFYP